MCCKWQVVRAAVFGSTFVVPDTSERNGFSCKLAITVCICPPRDGYHCPTLHERDPLLSIGPIHRPLSCEQPTQSDVLGASHDCMPRLPCTLSGSELPINYLDVPAGAQATAAALCVALCVSRAMHVEHVCSVGRVEGGA